MKIINNPFDILSEIMDEYYPDVDCEVLFGKQMTDGKEHFGCTLFPDDGSTPIVEIYPSLSVSDATEVLAHELAHVIAGEEAEHGEEWDKVFHTIHRLFEEKLSTRLEDIE